MNKIILLLTLVSSSTFAQNFNDKIITIKNDTINCNITFINDKNIFYDTQDKKSARSDYIPLLNVKSYNLDKDSKPYIFSDTKDTVNKFSKDDSLNVSQYIKKDSIRKNRIRKNSIYMELLGNAEYYSLNYERILFHKNFFSLSCRIGGLYYYGSMFNHTRWSVPFTINGTFKLYKLLYVEIGSGAAYYYDSYFDVSDGYSGLQESEQGFYCTAITGIRVQGYRGFLFRIDFTPIVMYYPNVRSKLDGIAWFGLSFGYSF